MNWDCIIIGGGPAGTTVASLLLKYRPNTSVLIIESGAFPRFHTGESLVTEINLILDEMGVFEAINEAGFVRKFGATFVWGEDRTPAELIFADLERPNTPAVGTAYSWHVERARYDAILLDHAEQLGATVRRQEAVTGLLKNGEQVVGVTTASGETHSARFVVDATGQSGLCGSLSDREMDPRLKNMASFAYFRGFQFDDDLNGPPGESRALIVSHAAGWSWLFPIRDDIVSVGTVRAIAAQQADTERTPLEVIQAAIDASPELSRVLSDATPVLDDPERLPSRHVRDFSYTSRTIHSPGLLRTGDAAGFVDPILSVGCFLSQFTARLLAYALNTVLSDDSVDEERILSAYAAHVTDTLSAFRELTYFYYGFNGHVDEWWQLANDLVRDTTFWEAVSDRQAFLQFATGFAANSSAFREANTLFDLEFLVGMFNQQRAEAAPLEPKVPRLQDNQRIQLKGPVELTKSAVPIDGKGRMAPSLRVRVSTADGSQAEGAMKRFHIPPSMAPLLDLMSDPHTLTELSERMIRTLGVPDTQREAVGRYTKAIVQHLVRRGWAQTH